MVENRIRAHASPDLRSKRHDARESALPHISKTFGTCCTRSVLSQNAQTFTASCLKRLVLQTFRSIGYKYFAINFKSVWSMTTSASLQISNNVESGKSGVTKLANLCKMVFSRTRRQSDLNIFQE